jgi:hypothetical protein
MTRWHLTAALAFVAASFANAQVQYSVNNYLRYGNGSQVSGTFEKQKEYVENQTNVRLLWSDFTLGLQYLHDNPPESKNVPSFVGIKKRYVEFQHEGIELRAGDFFTLYGRGMAVNLFENRGINYDTGLDGLRGIYRNDYLTVIGAFGNMKYYDLQDPKRIELYNIKSAHMEAEPLDGLRLGASAVRAQGELPSATGIDNVLSEIYEGMVTAKILGIDVFGEYAYKSSFGQRQIDVAKFSPFSGEGWGLYGSLSFSGEGFGATFEYKDYRFDVVDPLARDPNRPTRMLPVQNPPTVFKEHGFYFLSRDQHQIDFNDETGMQLDLFYSVTPRITLNLNGSMASRTSAWIALSNLRFKQVDRKNAFVPAFHKSFSPFYEVYGEVEWYLDDHSYVRAAVNRRYDAPYDETYAQQGNLSVVHEQSSWTFPLRIEYMLSGSYSIGASFEQQLYRATELKTPDYYNQYISLTLAKAPDWAATVRMEMTTTEFDPSLKKFWITGEFTHRIGNAHTAAVSYGTERGGLVCSNGICRLVEPFNGLRFSLLTQL